MEKIRLSVEEIRRLVIDSLLLAGGRSLPGDAERAAAIIEALGYVQIDTISVIERAHHHTLWNRMPEYSSEMLADLLGCRRRIFEYWAHAFCYVPLSDYRFYLPRMRSYHDPINKWEKERQDKYGHLLPELLERIRRDGPLTSSDARDLAKDEPKGPDWHPNPPKAALELLLLRGDVMVSERRNFQRVYDLTERVLPSAVDTRLPSDEELGRFLVRKAAAAQGVVSEKDIQQYIDAADKQAISQAIRELAGNGELLALEIEGKRNGPYFVQPQALERLEKSCHNEKRITFLSPFDNLLYSRERVERLFDFDYRLECYLPAAKRQFGYFALPVLWGENLVGLIDCKAERKEGILRVNRLVLSIGADFDGFLPAFIERLGIFARFNGCHRLRIENAQPANIGPLLQNALDKDELAA